MVFNKVKYMFLREIIFSLDFFIMGIDVEASKSCREWVKKRGLHLFSLLLLSFCETLSAVLSPFLIIKIIADLIFLILGET